MREKATVNAYFEQHRLQVVLWLVLTAFVAVLAPLKTFQLKWLIDSKSKQEAFSYIGVVLVITALSHLFEWLSRKVYTRMAAGALGEVRTAVVSRVLHRTYQEYAASDDAQLLSMLSSDARMLYDDYYMGIFEIIFWGTMMLVAVVFFGYLSPALLLVAILICIPTLLIPKLMNARMVKVRSEYSIEMSEYTGRVKELLGGYEVIRNFLREKLFQERHSEYAKRNSQKECNYQQSINAVIMSASLFSNLTLSLMLLVGVLLVYDGKITLGTMTSATNLITFVTVPCQRVTQAFAKIRGTKEIRRKFETQMCPDVKAEAQGEPLEEPESVICRNVAFIYPGTAKKVLQGVDMQLSRNEKIAIVGESGCGKSTFAKLLYQYYPEYEGSICFGRQELRKIDRHSLYRKVGYVSQSTFLFADSIRNNICMYEPFSEEAVNEAVSLAGLQSFVASLPEGVDTILEENGRNFSGGQRQRIGIARMIIRKYALVIADEVTASLDAETTQQVMENLLHLPCTMIVITHDTSGEFMHRFDKVYRMEAGKMEWVI